MLVHVNNPQCYLGQLAETVLAAVVEGVTGRGLQTGSSTLGQVGGGQGEEKTKLRNYKNYEQMI